MKKVAIGGGQGFWGDSPDAAIHMIRNADIQYMGCDYLAELTLSIMAKQQLKDPTKGFVPDFTTRILKEAGKEAWDKHIKICTNAGGMPLSVAEHKTFVGDCPQRHVAAGDEHIASQPSTDISARCTYQTLLVDQRRVADNVIGRFRPDDRFMFHQ